MLLCLPAALALAVSAAAAGLGAVRGAAGSPPRTRIVTALTLSIIALGLPAYVLVKVLTPGFYARRDTATPVKTAVVVLVANVILNFALIPPFGIAGLAAAVAICSWLNCVDPLRHPSPPRPFPGRALARLAARPPADRRRSRWSPRCSPIRTVLAGWFAGSVGHRLVGVIALVGGGMAVYFPLVWLLGGTDKRRIEGAAAPRGRPLDRCRLSKASCASSPASSRPATFTSAICSGAILRWVRMQDEAECLFFLADLHALTVDVDPAAAARQRPRNGGGADRQRHRSRPSRSSSRQSAVPAHAELAWILQCTARMGWLNRMTQLKDKSRQEQGRRVASACSPIRCSRPPTSCSTTRPTCRSARTRSSISS